VLAGAALRAGATLVCVAERSTNTAAAVVAVAAAAAAAARPAAAAAGTGAHAPSSLSSLEKWPIIIRTREPRHTIVYIICS